MPRRMPSKYKEYFKVLEKFGLEQLDVYRYKDKDVLRLRDSKGKVYIIELPGFREDLSIDEFKRIIERSIGSTK